MHFHCLTPDSFRSWAKMKASAHLDSDPVLLAAILVSLATADEPDDHPTRPKEYVLEQKYLSMHNTSRGQTGGETRGSGAEVYSN